jgi:peptidoglycan/xylan/chitin deacetylase (PgdA/CDA1 family)
MVSKLVESGMEIGDHTVDHPHLPELSLTDVKNELSDSKDYLQQFGPIIDFASPYGEVNNKDLHLIRQLYQSHRSTDVGLNTANEFDAYNIMCVTIDTQEGTSIQNIKHWIHLAIKTKTWLVLAFHQVDGPGQKFFRNNDPFNVSPEFLEEILFYIHTHQIQPMTVNEGLSEVYQQI